jgi:hypothetical protein
MHPMCVYEGYNVAGRAFFQFDGDDKAERLPSRNQRHKSVCKHENGDSSAHRGRSDDDDYDKEDRSVLELKDVFLQAYQRIE